MECQHGPNTAYPRTLLSPSQKVWFAVKFASNKRGNFSHTAYMNNICCFKNSHYDKVGAVIAFRSNSYTRVISSMSKYRTLNTLNLRAYDVIPFACSIRAECRYSRGHDAPRQNKTSIPRAETSWSVIEALRY